MRTISAPLGGGSPTDLAAVNRRAILDSVHASDRPVSVTDLCHLTGLSRPTVTSALEVLTRERLLVEAELGGSTPRGGRPGRRYRLPTDAHLICSVVLSRSGIDLQVHDLDANQRAAHHEVITDEYASVASIPDRVAELTDAVLAQVVAGPGGRQARLACITVAVLGIVADQRKIVRSGLFPQLEGTDLHDILAERFDVPVLVENDANLAALAEAADARSTGSMLGLLVGAEFGCGIVLNGQLHRGAHGAAGEVQHEAWVELFDLLRASDCGTPGSLNAYQRAAAGEPAAVAYVGRVAGLIGLHLAPVMDFLDPDLVVIGGEAAEAGSLIVDPLRQIFEASRGFTPEVTTTSLAGDTVSSGAYRLGSRFVRRHILRGDPVPDLAIQRTRRTRSSEPLRFSEPGALPAHPSGFAG